MFLYYFFEGWAAGKKYLYIMKYLPVGLSDRNPWLFLK